MLDEKANKCFCPNVAFFLSRLGSQSQEKTSLKKQLPVKSRLFFYTLLVLLG